jgi:MarR family transcriptional regulator, transcriptional regulator for hemolysin
MADIRDIWAHANNIIRSARQLINEDLKPMNLSSAEGNILLHLLTENQQLQQEEIVDQLDISKPAISRALKSLERKGFVKREKDPSDKRASRVLMTEKALQIGPGLVQVYNGVFSIAKEGISDRDIDGFIDLFSRVSENFSTARSKKRMQRRRG